MLSTFADGAIFGSRVGTGRPNVLALHGWRGDHQQVVGAVEGVDAIALDLPGFGSTPTPDRTWGAADYADAIAPVLDEFDAPPVVLGYSFGGRVAVNLAARYPDRIAALVLTGVPLIRGSATAKKSPLAFRLAKRAHKLGLLSDARMEAERKKRGSADYRAASGVLRDIFVRLVNESYDAQLKELRCPLYMVWGDADTEAPLAQAQAAAALVPGSELTIVSGGTHWMITEDPQPIRAVLQKAMQSARRTAADDASRKVQ